MEFKKVAPAIGLGLAAGVGVHKVVETHERNKNMRAAIKMSLPEDIPDDIKDQMVEEIIKGAERDMSFLLFKQAFGEEAFYKLADEVADELLSESVRRIKNE